MEKIILKFLCIVILVFFTLLAGCSAYLAVNQPPKKDLSILKEGTSREYLLAVFGAPVFSEKRAERRFEIFAFYKGSALGWNESRAVFHVAADVFSLGLWEIVGIPIELIIKGDMLAAKVIYDENDRIISSEIYGAPNKFGHYYEYSYKTPPYISFNDSGECSQRANDEAVASMRDMDETPALLFGMVDTDVQLSRAKAQLDSTYEQVMESCLQEKGFGDIELY